MIGMNKQIQPEVRIVQPIRSRITPYGLVFKDEPGSILIEALDLLTRLPEATSEIEGFERLCVDAKDRLAVVNLKASD